MIDIERLTRRTSQMTSADILQEILYWKELNLRWQNTLIFCLEHKLLIGKQQCQEVIALNNATIEALATFCDAKLAS